MTSNNQKAKCGLVAQVTCPVCMEVPRQGDLYQCSNGHLICEPCFDKIRKAIPPFFTPVTGEPSITRDLTCPSCRGSYILIATEPQKALLASNIINTISLACKYTANGCGQETTRRYLADHESLCVFAEVDCQNKSSGCYHKCLRQDMEKHAKECEYRIMRCRNAVYGCLHECKPSEEGIHLANGCDRQLIAMKFEEMKMEIMSLRREVEVLKSKLGQ